jgi:hypothetical protein
MANKVIIPTVEYAEKITLKKQMTLNEIHYNSATSTTTFFRRMAALLITMKP